MTDPALEKMIREVLAQEIARVKGEAKSHLKNPAKSRIAADSKCETVRITTSAELNDFARRVVALTRDAAALRDFEDGRLTFKLAGELAGGQSAIAGQSAGDSGAQMQAIEAGLVSERQIDSLARSVKRLRLGKQVRLTPLARDRARQRGISIERIEQ